MNYIELINRFWRIDDGAQFTGWETKLYFYLIKTANGLGWPELYWHSDAKTAANSGMSINTLKTARDKLKEVGLIDFLPGGKGFGEKTRYQILIPNPQPKVEPNQQPSLENRETRCQNLTPKVQPNLQPKVEPNPQPKAFRYQNLTPKVQPNVQPLNKQKQKLISTTTTKEEEEELKKNEPPDFVKIQQVQAAGFQKKIITAEALTAKLLNNETCKMSAKNAHILADKYPEVVNQFVSEKFDLGENEKWKDLPDALSHFRNWVKFYPQIKYSNGSTNKIYHPGKTTGREIVERPAADDSRLETGPDGVLRRISGKGVSTFAG